MSLRKKVYVIIRKKSRKIDREKRNRWEPANATGSSDTNGDSGADVRKLRSVLAMPLAQVRAGGEERGGGRAVGGTVSDVTTVTSQLWRQAARYSHQPRWRRPQYRTARPLERTSARSFTTISTTDWLWVSARAVSAMCSAAWGSC